jgi:uncharacterized protein DUF3179
VVHVRRIDGKPLRFGHRGWLWRNAFLLYDTGTDSVWHHQTGRALSGPMRGRQMARIPSSFSTWGAWRAEHPATLLLDKPEGPRFQQDEYASRNRQLAFGLGVEIGPLRRLYRLADLQPSGFVEEEAGGVPIIVALHSQGRSAAAFDRRVRGATLHLSREKRAEGVVLAEVDGDRRWALPGGTPLPASGARVRLKALAVSLWEVGAWTRQHPGGSVRQP